MTEHEEIIVSRSDSIALYRIRETEISHRLLRTSPALDTIECRRLHHGASVAREIYDLQIGRSLDWRSISGEVLEAYETYVPASACLTSELTASGHHFPILSILRIMRNTVEQLHQCFHSRDMIHCDVRPESILLLHPDTCQVCLTGLEYSSLECPLRAMPNTPILNSSILTAAPEISGRLPYMVDERSDLYSIGVVFYKLSSGHYPFQGETLPENLHGHIANEAADLSPNILLGIRKMVNKLLSKNPSKRYQTAQSLLHDIDYAIDEIEAGNLTLEDMQIGQIDNLWQSAFEEYFVGRTNELVSMARILKSVWENHKTKLTTISGGSGSGKSHLVNNFLSTSTSKTSRYGVCKVNQRSLNHVSTLGSVKYLISDVIKQCARGSSDESHRICAELVKELSEDLVPLAQLSPELALFLGDALSKLLVPSPAYDISPASLDARIQSSIVRFFQVFATSTKALVLFVDDIQWATPADYKILTDITKNTTNIMLVVAYRSTEVMQEMQEKFLGNKIDLIVSLEDLSIDDAVNLLAHSFGRRCSEVRELASIISSKTVRNFFYFKQFTQSLLERGDIYFDFSQKCWDFDLAGIRAVQPTSDVVIFILDRIAQMDNSTKDILIACACIARPMISADHIITISGMPEVAVRRELNALCFIGLLQNTVEDDSYEGPEANQEINQSNVYQFSNDRIQQAALQLLPEHERPAKRFFFGRRLLDATDIDDVPANVILDICTLLMDYLSERPTLEDPEDAARILGLFVTAAEISKQPESRLTYLQFAKLLMSNSSTSDSNAAHLDLEESLLDALIAVGDREQSLTLIRHLQSRLLKTAMQIRLMQKEAKIHWSDLNDKEVRRLGQAGLRLAGFDVDFEAGADAVMLTVMDFIIRIPQTADVIAKFGNHKIMEDEILLASQSLQVTIVPAIFFISAYHLIALVLAIGVSTVFDHGISTDGCYLLTFYGLTMCDVCVPGYSFAKSKALADLALGLSDKIRHEANTRRGADILSTMYVLQGGVNIWSVNNRSQLIGIYKAAREHTQRAYNSEYSAYSHTNSVGFFGMLRGHPLQQLNLLFGPRTCLDLIFRGDRPVQLFSLPTLQTLDMLLQCQSLTEYAVISGDIIQDESAVEHELFAWACRKCTSIITCGARFSCHFCLSIYHRAESIYHDCSKSWNQFKACLIGRSPTLLKPFYLSMSRATHSKIRSIAPFGSI